MRKIVFVFIVVFNAPLAYADLITDNTSNYCDFISMQPNLSAVFEPNEYTCASGYYLPANHDGCEPCPSEHTCNGGTFTFDENKSQGITYGTIITSGYDYGCDPHLAFGFYTAVFEPNSHECSSGYYLPAGTDECIICPQNSYCSGGVFFFNETENQGINTCASGLFSPSGSSSDSQCGHKLHVGNDVVYLRSVKKTTPSLHVKIGNDIYYGNMTMIRTKMNTDLMRYFRIGDYYLCDDTTCPEQ